MAQHGQLGSAGRARRGAQHGHVGGAGRLDLLFEHARFVASKFLAEFLDVCEGQERRVFVARQPAGVVIHDVLEGGEILPSAENLVDLFLVFRHHHARLRRFENVLHLLDNGVLVDADRHCARRLCGEFCDDPLRPVVADDRDAVAALHTELPESE